MVNAVATLLFSASYLPGALVLAHTLRQTEIFNEELKLVVLLATDLTEFEKSQLGVFDEVIPISLIHSRYDSDEFKSLKRPELTPTYSKINLFKLTEFEKVLYLDSDTLPLKSISSIIDQDIGYGDIVASPDSGWPDIFNSGVFLIKPSVDTYLALLNKIQTSNSPSFDGADQGLLNEFFHLDGTSGYSWKRLPFLFNVTPSGQYQYQPAFNYFQDKIKLVHFIGSKKPWFEVEDKEGLRYNWWLKYYEFFGVDENVQKTIHGITPVYYEPEKEEEKEPEVNDKDLLLDPNSYKGFDTINSSNQWNAEFEEPPKSGKAEAELFPSSLRDDYGTWNNDSYQSNEEEFWRPEPIFPYERENPYLKPDRVFDEPKYKNWESLPLIRKIKDKQQEELKAQERARKLAEEQLEDSEFDLEKKERLKEIERRYSGDVISPASIEQDLMDLEDQDDEIVTALTDIHID